MENKLKKEKVSKPKAEKVKKGVTLRKLLSLDNYLDKDVIAKQLPFLLFLFGLCVIYIWNGHFQMRTIRQVEAKQKEIKELRFELMTAESELMNMIKQTELIKMVDTLGLQELKSPPTILYLNEH
jgi:hypothetical protein